MLFIIISILLLQTVNIDCKSGHFQTTCSMSEVHKMISKIQECQKKELDNFIEQIQKDHPDHTTTIQESICNWHDTMVEQCIKPNIQDCHENEEDIERVVDTIVVSLLDNYPGSMYSLLSNCESVKELMTTNSATKKCNAHEIKLAKDDMLNCVKAQKHSWNNKLRNHRSASNLEKRFVLCFLVISNIDLSIIIKI